MKARSLTIVLLALSAFSCIQSEAQVLHYMMERVEGLVSGKWENTDDGGSNLNYYNEDYCPYIFLSDGQFKILNPGRTTVYSSKSTDGESPYKYGYRYYLYRGRFLDKDFDPSFVYALPMKNGAEVKWKIDRREPKRTFLFECESCDTVYASRAGVVCKINTDNSAVLMYHQDHTFAGYMNLSDSFVTAGQNVNVGDPIGSARYEGLSFTVFFLDKNLFEDGNKLIHPYTHIIPFFRTDEGDIRLEEDVEYKVVVDTELVTGEMNKLEKKRYLKSLL